MAVDALGHAGFDGGFVADVYGQPGNVAETVDVENIPHCVFPALIVTVGDANGRALVP
jgi:hypothetical protein